MPIYEYVCEGCNKKFEKLVKSMSSTEAAVCPKCGSKKTARQFSAFAVGSGESKGSDHGAGCGCCANAGSCPNANFD